MNPGPEALPCRHLRVYLVINQGLSEDYLAFVGPDSDKQDSGTTIGQIFLAGTAAEAG